MSEQIKHSFSITGDDTILVNGVAIPPLKVLEFLESGWRQMKNNEQEIELLKANNSDRKKLIDEILTAIQDREVITGDRLESWGQEEEHINHRLKS